MKTFLVVVLVALAVLAAVEGRPSRRLSKRDTNFGQKQGGPSPCKITSNNGNVIERPCGNSVACSTTSAVQFSSGSDTYDVFFCDVPFPTLRMACKVVDASGVAHHMEPKDSGMACDETLCTVGPYEAKDPCNNTVTYYICSDMPKQYNFTKALVKEACEVNGEEEDDCDDSKPCEGVQITVNSIQARYCQASSSEGFNWLDLFGKKKSDEAGPKKSSSSSKSEESEESEESKESDEAKSEESVESEEEIKCYPPMTTAAPLP